jgi:hypothetical protein
VGDKKTLAKWSIFVTIKFREPETAEKLNETTYADSTSVPKGMVYKQRVLGSSLTLECSDDRPERLRSTVDEVLEQLDLAIRLNV